MNRRTQELWAEWRHLKDRAAPDEGAQLGEMESLLVRCRREGGATADRASRADLQVLANTIVHEIAVRGGAAFATGIDPYTLDDQDGLTSSVRWDVNLQKTRIFIGRDDILSRVHHSLQKKRPTVLVGAGGIGKTQIALQYLVDPRYCRSYLCSAFVRGETGADLYDAYWRAAFRFGISIGREAGYLNAEAAVREFLGTKEKWLLVIDDATDPEWICREWLPAGFESKGSVLMTSRRQVVAREGSLPIGNVLVGKMTEEDAMRFLTTKLGLAWERLSQQGTKLSGGGPAILGAVACVEDAVTSIRGLARRLNHYPLALDHAATYVSTLVKARIKKGSSLCDSIARGIAEYIQLLDAKDGGCVANTLAQGDLDNPHAPIVPTVEVALDRLRRQAPPRSGQAMQVLKVMSLLGSAPVPGELFFGEVLDVPLERGRQEDIFESAAEESLVDLDRRDGKTCLSMHELIRELLRARMEPKERNDLLGRVIRRLADKSVFPLYRSPTWRNYRVWFPHVEVISKVIVDKDMSSADAGRLLQEAAQYALNDRPLAGEARIWFEKAIEIRDKLAKDAVRSGGVVDDSVCSRDDLACSIHGLGTAFAEGAVRDEITSETVRENLERIENDVKEGGWGVLGKAVSCGLWAREVGEAARGTGLRRSLHLLGRLHRLMGNDEKAKRSFTKAYDFYVPSNLSSEDELPIPTRVEGEIAGRGWVLIQEGQYERGLRFLVLAYNSRCERYGEPCPKPEDRQGSEGRGGDQHAHARTMDLLCELAATLTELGVDDFARLDNTKLGIQAQEPWWDTIRDSLKKLNLRRTEDCWEVLAKAALGGDTNEEPEEAAWRADRNKKYLVRALVGRAVLARNGRDGPEAKKLLDEALRYATESKNNLDQAMVRDHLRQLYVFGLASGSPQAEKEEVERLLGELGIVVGRHETVLKDLRLLYPR